MIDFAAFVATKEWQAAQATIFPLTTAIEAPAPGAVAVGNAWTRRLFDGDFFVSRSAHGLPSTSLVFVQSKDGNTGAANPSTLGGGTADQHLIYEGLSRVAADAVLAGAQTVRGSTLVLSVWHPELVKLRQSLGLPRHPVQMIATRRGVRIRESLMFNVPDLRVVLMTTPAGVALMRDDLASHPWITPVVMEAPAGLVAALRRVRDLGIERVSCIGGRSLAGQLIDAGLIDDVYLTTAATGGGEPNTPLYPRPLGGRTAVLKRGTQADEGVLFEQIALSEATGARSA